LPRLFLLLSMFNFDNLVKSICILTFNFYLKFEVNGLI